MSFLKNSLRGTFALACGLACSLLFPVATHLRADPVPIPEQGNYLRTAEGLVKAYIAANGGVEYINTINSVRMVGKVTEADITYDVVLIKKRPDLRRMILRWQGRSIHVGYNGTQAWRRVNSGTTMETKLLDGSDAEQFANDSQFDGPLVHWNENHIKLELLGLDLVGRNECYLLRTTDVAGMVTDTYLDTKAFTELKVVQNPFASKAEETIETHMSDYRKYDSIWLAMRIKRMVNGKLMSDMKVESVDLNFGVFNDYFDPPKTDEEK